MHTTTLRIAAYCFIAVLPTISCAPSARSSDRQTPRSELDTKFPADSTPLNLEAVAARALAVSPRVQATRFRVIAAASRADAAARPPDPTLAIALGLPIDGLGGTGISASIMASLGWLLARDAIVDAAEQEREIAARELLAACAETAADARRLARVVVANSRAAVAAEQILAAHTQLLLIERTRVEVGDSPSLAVNQAEGDAIAAQSVLDGITADVQQARMSLASVLDTPILPEFELLADESVATPTIASLEVLLAEVAVQRATAALASIDTPLGTNAQVGAGYMRDLEDRQAIEGSIGFSLPIFRRGYEVAAAQAELAALEQSLIQARRTSALTNDQALLMRTTAAERVKLARRAEISAGKVLAAKLQSHLLGESTGIELASARVVAASASLETELRTIDLAEAVARIESRVIHTPTVRAEGGS